MTFDDLSRLLHIEDIEMHPSELHGLFCGRLAGGERLAGDEMRKAMLESLPVEEEMVDNAFDELVGLYQQCLADFKDANLTFQPLLPEDEAPMAQRVAALARWCQGFIAGLGDSGLIGQGALSEDALNALKDMTAIAQVRFDGEAEDGDEGDFTELQEFVRVTAMLIFAERGARSQPPENGEPTIH